MAPTETAPLAWAWLTSLIEHVEQLDVGYSDLHLRCDQNSQMRVFVRREDQQHREVVDLRAHGIDLLSAERFLTFMAVCIERDRLGEQLSSRGAIDDGFSLRSERYRLNLFRYSAGEVGCVIRKRKKTVPAVDELLLPFDVKPWLALRTGLLLVCGSIGSGKSTTLAAMIEHMNEYRSDHVLTIEDPIEYVFEHRRCLITQREIGRDAPTWGDAIYAALRQAPQVLMVGEIRDYEALMAVLRFAEAGHLVLATLHSESTEKAIERVVDMAADRNSGEVRSLLAGLLRGIIVQTLVTGKDGRRHLAAEVVQTNAGIRSLIREGKHALIQPSLHTTHKDSGVSLNDSLARLVANRHITAEAALAASYDPSKLRL